MYHKFEAGHVVTGHTKIDKHLVEFIMYSTHKIERMHLQDK